MPTCTCIYRRMSEWSVFGCTETPQIVQSLYRNTRNKLQQKLFHFLHIGKGYIKRHIKSLPKYFWWGQVNFQIFKMAAKLEVNIVKFVRKQ